MTPDLDDLTERLRTGGWQMMQHADARDEALWFYRSVLDPRVQLRRRVPRRGKGVHRDEFSFGDAEIDVENPTALLISSDAPRTFSTLRDLVSAIVAHDRELADERAWQAAAPGDRP